VVAELVKPSNRLGTFWCNFAGGYLGWNSWLLEWQATCWCNFAVGQFPKDAREYLVRYYMMDKMKDVVPLKVLHCLLLYLFDL
jgi:hypothetical protein